MATNIMREKLQDYIKKADNKKIKAIYTLVEDEINEESGWWKDDEFVTELENEYDEIVKGTAKTYTAKEVEASIQKLRKERNEI